MILKRFFIIAIFTASLFSMRAQSNDSPWTYQQCLDYARTHNIELRQSLLSKQSSVYDLEAARAKWLPSLSVSTNQTFTNAPRPKEGESASNVYNATYGLNANWAVYDGGSRTSNIKRQELLSQRADLSIEEKDDNLITEIFSSYLQILYAKESIDVAKRTLEVSKHEMERAEALMNSGRISKVDFAQLQSQYNTDRYNLVNAEATYSTRKLELKQLLELGIADDIALEEVQFDDSVVLAPIPDKILVYNNALAWNPAMKGAQLSSQISQANLNIAKASGHPNISLNAGVGTNHNSQAKGITFGNQLLNGLNENVGLAFSYNIFDQKATKTAVAKAKVDILNSELDLLQIEKNLSRTIESIHIDAITAQQRYQSGKAQLASAELTEELTTEKFNIGKVNTLELLASHNALLNARVELLQAKYLAILNIKMLEFYSTRNISF